MFKKVSLAKFEGWMPFPTTGLDKAPLLTQPVKISKPIKDTFLSNVRPNGVNPKGKQY